MYFGAPTIRDPVTRQRSFVLVTALLAFMILGTVAVYAYDSAHDDQIAKGVKAGGIDIGGMHTAAARTKLLHVLTAQLGRPVTVVYKQHHYRLDPRKAGMKIDAKGMVDEALQKSRGGNVLTRTVRGIFGGSVHADVPIQVSYSHRAVAKLVKRVQSGIDRPAQNASVTFSTGILRKVKARNGHFVKRAELRREVQLALAAPGASRKVTVPLTVVTPKITTRQLASQYPTVITINRGAFALTLYKKLKLAKSYTIAVGRQGLETPAGEYTVQDKQINPSWHVPNSSWAGSLAGRVIPPGPQDPLKARWIGITDGAGIHGTSDIGSLGSAASHGCIRMSIPDVIELYGRTPYGSKIFVY